jgi:hypothetical protein
MRFGSFIRGFWIVARARDLPSSFVDCTAPTRQQKRLLQIDASFGNEAIVMPH